MEITIRFYFRLILRSFVNLIIMFNIYQRNYLKIYPLFYSILGKCCKSKSNFIY